MKRLIALFEVALALALFLYLRKWLKDVGFGDWQDPLFGAPLVSSCLLFFVLPMMFVLIGGRNPGSVGLTTHDMKYHLRVAARAIAFVFPATFLFPVVGALGLDPMEWLGASILTAGFVVAGALFAIRSQSQASLAEAELSWKGLPIYVALLIGGLIISYLLQPLSPLLTRIVAVLIFVGFLEEFFFRGYVQSRLNDSFGKPFKFRNVQFGAGLLLAAVVFGLFHPLTVANETPWAWALWTTALGLVFGFLREKTGTIVAPALLHGVILIPTAFLSGG